MSAQCILFQFISQSELNEFSPIHFCHFVHAFMPANSCGIYSAVFETCKGHILSTVDYENIKASLNQKKTA